MLRAISKILLVVIFSFGSNCVHLRRLRLLKIPSSYIELAFYSKTKMTIFILQSPISSGLINCSP